ncbi:MAG: hypothetical protein NTZ60_01245 [Campylobacterales bacterium]|nr:hypothetical protein [Campylobacterales bacterium]
MFRHFFGMVACGNIKIDFFQNSKISMSKYEQLIKKELKNFKRLIGVNKDIFEAMIDVFKSYEDARTKNHGIGGRKSLIP